MERLFLRAAAAAIVVGCALSARADIVGFGGAVAVRTPPADISLGLWESNTEARLWSERSVVLTSPLHLDAVNTGTIATEGDAIPGQVTAGNTVASYMLRVDSVGSTEATYSGYVEFDQPVLGVLIFRSTLNGSDDLLGRAGVTYNTNAQRGLDFPPQVADPFTVSADRRRIDFAFSIGNWTDDIRIVTAVPAPGSAVLGLLLGGVGLLRRSRRA